MSTLKKNSTTTIIPGNPGVPSTPGSPYIPARCYSVPVFSYHPILIPPGPYFAAVSSWNTTSRLVTQCSQDVAAVPASPGIPPTPQQISQSLNKGWNSWARSIDQIPKGDFFQFAVAPGVSGAFLGLGVRGMEGQGVHTFPHGLLADLSGVWVYESGVKVLRLSLSYSGADALRIVRQSDGSIAYLLIQASGTVAHPSAVPGSILPLYGYGYLYSGGDSINSADITTGEVQYGSA